MERKNFMRRRCAFSLAELLIVMTIMTIMAAAIVMSPSVGKPTAKQEAERIAAYIHRAMQKADRTHESLSLWTRGGKQALKQGNKNHEFIPISEGFTLTRNNDDISYDTQRNAFQQGCTYTVTRDSDGSKYYIIISVTGGRIRTSATDSDDD